VGGLQNTVTNLGASLGTALVGSVLIASLTAAFIQGVQDNPQVPSEAKQRVTTELSNGIPFISDTALRANLEKAGVDEPTAQAILDENAAARLAQTRLPFAAFSAFVRNPPSGSMPPFRAKVMSDQELADVYAYIKTFPEPKPVKDIPLLSQ